MAYKKLTKEEGFEFFPNVWTVFVGMEKDFFAEPYTGQGLRYRTLFQIDKGKMKIYFHLNGECHPEGTFLENIQKSYGKIYLFGAYNNINVVQMRARGTITKVIKGKEDILSLIEKNLTDNVHVIGRNKCLSKPDHQEAERAISLLSEGHTFCFNPDNNSFADDGYQRG